MSIQTIRSALAPPPPPEQLALRQMPALQRPPGLQGDNAREVLKAAVSADTGKLVDRLA